MTATHSPYIDSINHEQTKSNHLIMEIQPGAICQETVDFILTNQPLITPLHM